MANGCLYLLFSWFGILALIQSIGACVLWANSLKSVFSHTLNNSQHRNFLVLSLSVNSATIGPIVFMVCLMMNEEVRHKSPH